jgi:hypothetical protein
MDSLKFDTGDFYEYLLRKSNAEQNDTHGAKIEYKKRGAPLHEKQKLSNTARCLETSCYILTFCAVTLHFYFNFNPNIFVIPYILDYYKELIYTCSSFTDIQYAAYILIVLYSLLMVTIDSRSM